MKILVTGAEGFIGKNLCAALRSLRDCKDRTRPGLSVEAVFEYDIHTAPERLAEYAGACDFVFHLAGVNRPQQREEFMAGNFGFTEVLLSDLRAHGNKCPIMLASSVQATCIGRYDHDYGRSKRAGEELLFAYGEETGAETLVYRFPNVFGKWCRPNYNSAVATFCHNIANGLPIQVNDRATELELLYIDDLVAEMLDALEGHAHRCDFDGTRAVFHEDGRYCAAPQTHRVTLGEIADLLASFAKESGTPIIPEIPANSFEKKLYSTYISYLPRERIAVPLKMNVDARGSFTELLKTAHCGQVSVNISKPGVTKGEHWHHSKWEFFIVVAGHGLIRLRRLGSDEILDFEVSGERIEAIRMLPGYTHNIINLSKDEDLVTVMWANESFDSAHPDTFGEAVESNGNEA